MNARERVLALIIGGLVGLAALDWFVIEPAWAWFADQTTRTEALDKQLVNARLLVDNADTIEERWGALAAAGLTRDEGALRIEAQQSLSVWASEAGFSLTTLVSGRTVAGDPFDEMQFIASGSGTLDQTLGFLNRMSASPFPLRLLDLDLTSRSETADAVSVRATFSTIRLAREVSP